MLESKDMGVIFKKNGKEMLKKAKYLKILPKKLINLKIFLKKSRWLHSIIEYGEPPE